MTGVPSSPVVTRCSVRRDEMWGEISSFVTACHRMSCDYNKRTLIGRVAVNLKVDFVCLALRNSVCMKRVEQFSSRQGGHLSSRWTTVVCLFMYIPCVFIIYYLLFVPSNPYTHTHTHTHTVTPWSRVLLEKLTGSQQAKKFPAFYGTRKFITVLTSARYHKCI
jgi:hypothetical protein